MTVEERIGTVDAIISLCENIYDNLNNRMHTISISVHFRKSFDTVNHVILLKKSLMLWCPRSAPGVVCKLPNRSTAASEDTVECLCL